MHLPLFETKKKITNQFDPLADIVLYNGDTKMLAGDIPNDFVKLIVTSPPYNIGKSYETKTSIDLYLDAQTAIIEQLVRILHPEGSICWQVGNYIDKGEVFPLDIFYYQIFKQYGLTLKNRIVWYFGHGLHATKRFSGRYEMLLWFTKSPDKYTFNLDDVRVPAKYPGKRHFKGPKKGQISGNPKGKNPSDIWEIVAQDWETGLWNIPNVKSNHPEKTIHPAQFPVELVERCVLAFSNEGDWVFDPYSGVGSSIIAAVKHNRRAMGAEKEEEYLAITTDRLTQYFNGSLRLRPLGKPVHKPSGKLAKIPAEWQQNEQQRLLEDNTEYDV